MIYIYYMIKNKDINKKINEDEDEDKDEEMIYGFIKNEKNKLIDFLAGFQIIGLTIASIIGLSASSLSKTFTNEIIMPLIEPLFSKNWKTFTVDVGQSKLGIGLFLSDIIYLTVVILTMFIIYSLFKTYLSNIIKKKRSSNKKLYKYQMKIINELSSIKKELQNNKKHNEV